MSDHPRVSFGDPHDRLTALAQRITGAYDGDPVLEGVRYLLLLSTPEDGGVKLYGYEQDDMSDVMADLLWHAMAIFKAFGMELVVVPINNSERS